MKTHYDVSHNFSDFHFIFKNLLYLKYVTNSYEISQYSTFFNEIYSILSELYM